MQALVIGAGGREHALAWKLAQSPQIDKVYVAPGNAGTAAEPGLQNLALGVDEIEALADFASDNGIALTLIGPEAPLVNGIVNHFRQRGLACFGPDSQAAQLEGSKSFAKDFMARHDIPTASHAVFTEQQAALAHVRAKGAPIVIKADGLAAGKGVVVAETLEAAEEAITDMLGANRFGDAGHQVVIEDYLEGEEASFIVMADGKHFVPMATSQDHKPVGNGDTGPNTGGMGAYSPAPVVTDAVYARILSDIIEPTLAGMGADGHPYTGFLYAGLMIDKNGQPFVIEFNCRFGDPEAQPILMRLKSDFADLLQSGLTGKLDEATIKWDQRPALGVVMASGGYPGSYRKGDIIQGLDSKDTDSIKVFHAGTRTEGDSIVTNGGRVLCVTAMADNLWQAQQDAYENTADIHWKDAFYRKDIGFRVLEKSVSNQEDSRH